MTLQQIAELAESYVRKYNPDNIAPFPFENVVHEHDDLDVYFTDLDDYDILLAPIAGSVAEAHRRDCLDTLKRALDASVVRSTP